jgi:cytochrome c-type biogenesis protein CcmH/NrfG
LAAAAFARGQEAFGKGQLEAARAAFELSKQRDDKFALPWIGLSNVYLRKKQLKKAIDAAQQAQVLAPRLWPAVTASARAYVHKGQLDFGIQEYRRALDLAGEQPYLLSELALTYHAAHMDQDAERYAQRALELDPDLVPALILLAERALEDANGKLAVEYSQRATGVEPRDVTGWLALGDGYILLDKRDAALNAWRTALRLWRETRQRGAPESRLREVQSALDNDKLPAPRGGASGSDSGRSTPVAEQATVARSQPAARSRPAARSKPQPRSKPASAPAPAPLPRSRPDAKKAPERSTPSPLDGLDQ